MSLFQNVVVLDDKISEMEEKLLEARRRVLDTAGAGADRDAVSGAQSWEGEAGTE